MKASKIQQRKSRLKTLADRRDRLAVLLASLREQRSEASREIEWTEGRLAEVQHEMDRTKGNRKTLAVSEHAIVRYMERVHGIDIEQIKREIVGGDPNKMNVPITCAVPVNGHIVKIDGNVVVTVVTKEGQET